MANKAFHSVRDNKPLKPKTMNIELMNGTYPRNEGVDLVLRMIEVKIKYHEQKITRVDNEEDIKMRELRIKQLQNEASRLRQELTQNDEPVKLKASVLLY